MRLANKVALITGSGRGIGRVTAETFAKAGATVVVCDVDEETITATVADITTAGGTAKAMLGDVTNRAQIADVVGAIVAEFGKLDILINNAGITRDARLVKLTEAEWDAVINVNLKGVFNCTQAVAPTMMQAGYGRIINAASVVGVYGNFGQTNYVAAKAGVIGMTKTWAKELGGKGITVNAVAPGFIETAMVEDIPDHLKQMVIFQTPLKRMGTSQEVAHAYLFLASDEASFINGHCLHVDGGLAF